MEEEETIEERAARIVRPWKPLDRCVARLTIYYANAQLEVDEGTLGTVRSVPHSGVAIVAWDGLVGDPLLTAAESIGPVPS